METYCVYWIHTTDHITPTDDGYVGITKQKHQYKGRIADHFRKLRRKSEAQKRRRAREKQEKI